jgi:hypothetical protein
MSGFYSGKPRDIDVIDLFKYINFSILFHLRELMTKFSYRKIEMKTLTRKYPQNDLRPKQLK